MNHTEDDLRGVLSSLAREGEDEFHVRHEGCFEPSLDVRHPPMQRLRRPTGLALASAACVAAVIVGAAVASSQLTSDDSGGQDSAGPAALPTPATSWPASSSSASPQAPATLEEVFAALGNPYRDPAGQPAVISRDEALKRAGATYSLGLVEVGQEKVAGDNEAKGEVTVSWRLSWVVAWEPQSVWQGTSKAGVDGKSGYVFVTEVAFVDAMTGEVYSHAQF